MCRTCMYRKAKGYSTWKWPPVTSSNQQWCWSVCFVCRVLVRGGRTLVWHHSTLITLSAWLLNVRGSAADGQITQIDHCIALSHPSTSYRLARIDDRGYGVGRREEGVREGMRKGWEKEWEGERMGEGLKNRGWEKSREGRTLREGGC